MIDLDRTRKGNCLDNVAVERVFRYLKDECYMGRVSGSCEWFRAELDAYIVRWNAKRRQMRLEERAPAESRSVHSSWSELVF